VSVARLMREALVGDLVKPGLAIDGVESNQVDQRSARNANLHILLLLSVILAPLVVRHISTEQYLPGFAGIALSLVFVANLWLLAIGRQAFLSPAMVLLLTVPLVVLSVIYGQEYSLFWIYPLLVAVPSVLRTSEGLALGVLCLLVIVPLVFSRFETGLAVIISLSMIHTLLVSWWLMRAVNYQSSRFLDMVIHDPLTGAKNRRHFQHELKSAYSLWVRHKRISTLIFLDVDHFKRVNDDLGHGAGDVALQGLVKVVQDRIRGVDTVFRYGGEEFAVLLPETSASRAMALANDLRAQVEDTEIVAGRKITVSSGVCDVSVADSADDWVKKTDEALYRAKSAGRNRVEQVASVVQLPEAIGDALPVWR